MTDIAAQVQAPASLALEYIIPPFTVLDGRQGYWIERKQRWNALGITAEMGRDEYDGKHAGAQAYNWNMGGKGGRGSSWERDQWSHPTTSMFDPVLCEVVYQWWSPAGGTIIDPFAGEATKGVIAAKLGRRYYGVELRPEQIQANEEQAARLGVMPTWIARPETTYEPSAPLNVLAGIVADRVTWIGTPYEIAPFGAATLYVGAGT